jgi:hypothetical protein
MELEKISHLLFDAAQASELYSVIATFKGSREHKRDGMKSIIIEVLDMGPGGPENLQPYRFLVRAYDEDGRYATGNGGESIDIAIATVHWGDLDDKPRIEHATNPWKAMF